MYLLHFIQKFPNQALRPGSVLMRNRKPLTSCGVLALTLMLVGSCNNSYLPFWSGERADLAEMNMSRLMRYAQVLQGTVAERPETFLDLRGEDVRLILAEPDLAWQEASSASWQYKAGECVLDIYLDTDKDSVAYYEFRSADAVADDTPSSWNCMQSLYEARAKVIEANFQQVFASAQKPASEG